MRLLILLILTVSGLVMSFSYTDFSRKSVSTLIIPTLYYDYADSVPNNRIDISLLDSLTSIMRVYPRVCIEIQGHTDVIEDQKLDTNLSWRRAGIIRSMLITKGVESHRLSIRGYRARHTMNHCSYPTAPCSDEEHALNRRIHVKITKVD